MPGLEPRLPVARRDRARARSSAPRSARVQGSIVAFLGVPVLRRHARRPARLAGRDHLAARHAGRDRDPGPADQRRRELRPAPRTLGWIARDRLRGRYAAVVVRRRSRAGGAGLPTGNLAPDRRRASSSVGGLAVRRRRRLQPLARRAARRRCSSSCCWSCSSRTSRSRTTFGRHVYAVGGNAEAARRAGINVKLIRILVLHRSRGPGGRRRRHPRLAPATRST